MALESHRSLAANFSGESSILMPQPTEVTHIFNNKAKIDKYEGVFVPSQNLLDDNDDEIKIKVAKK